MKFSVYMCRCVSVWGKKEKNEKYNHNTCIGQLAWG